MIIVTGGAGFIGSCLVAELNEAGFDNILIVDHLGTDLKWRNLRALNYRGFVDKKDFLPWLESGVFGVPQAIFHLGACSATTEPDADYLMQNNVDYSLRIIRWCAQQAVQCVYASSAATYGGGEHGFSDATEQVYQFRPLNMYGYSKLLTDQIVIKEGLDQMVTGLRFFNVYGPNEYHKGDMASLIYKAYFQIKDTGAMKLFKSYHPDYPDGGQGRDFVYVRDCAQAMVGLLRKPKQGIYNIGSGRFETWNTLAESIFSAMGLESNIEYIDMPETLEGQYQYYTKADLSKGESKGLELTRTSIQDGVTDYIQNYLSAAEGLKYAGDLL